jgi:hypothetical protein
MELSFQQVGGSEIILLHHSVIPLTTTVAFLINPFPTFALESRRNEYIAEIAVDIVLI